VRSKQRERNRRDVSYHPGVEDVGVYVHVPFCERVCPYCDFAVVGVRTLAPEREARYVDALLAELGARRARFTGRRLASLYLGGGTPSLLTPESVDRIRVAVFGAFQPDAPEVTLEMNPGTVERERLPGFHAAGVNRLCVGVQSFTDATLKRLGRAHGAEEARKTLAVACGTGFAALSIDLIFAAPGQRVASTVRDLAEALAFAPDHVSAYELTVEAGTPFALADERSQLDRADEAEVVEMMGAVEERLAAAGLARYEISNYARPGREAVHNRRYWERRPVLGLGVAAVSSDPPDSDAPHGRRRSNPRDLETWQTAALGGSLDAVADVESLAPAVARGEAAFLALRTAAGLDAGRFAAEFGAPPRGFWGPAIAELADRGLLAESGAGDLQLTPAGRRLADAIFQYFV